MYANPGTAAKNNITVAKRYQRNGKIFRVLKWIGLLSVIISLATVGLVTILALMSYDAWYFFDNLLRNYPIFGYIIFGYTFIIAAVGGVLAGATAIAEKVMKNRAKWHGDLGYYLHRCAETGDSYESISKEIEADLAEARKTRNYKHESYLHKIQVEIKRILRNAPEV